MERNPALRRAFLADRSFLAAAGWALLAVAVPTVVRWVIDRGAAGVPFLTYFPAVVLSALFLGWRWGVVVAVASTVLANRLFRPEPLLFYAGPREALLGGLFVLSCSVLIWVCAMARRLVRELEATKEREETVSRELLHRVKNLLATVNAMAVLTARHKAPEDFAEAFSGRILALEKATALLGRGGRQCQMATLVEGVLAPFRAADNFTVEGPGCELPQDTCVPLALTLHELATNAAKHGALTAPGGRVDLRWTVGEGDAGMLRLVWREHGGPPVPEEREPGMGTQLLRPQRGLAEVEVVYPPEGLRCTIGIRGVKPVTASRR